MATNSVQFIEFDAPAARPLSAAVERRQGEAILLDPAARREMPPGGLKVLMIGGSPIDLMLQGIVLNDLAGIARVESASDARAAFQGLVERPESFDLVLLSDDAGMPAAGAFARALKRRLPSLLRPGTGPLLVRLARHLGPADRDAGLFAARLLLPLSHDHCRNVLARLFRD